jgi:NADH:ubiquinone oxidoreductase subunit 6 (subunit J)
MLVVLQVVLFVGAVWFSVAMQLEAYRNDIYNEEDIKKRICSAIKRVIYALMMIIFASSLILMLGGDGTVSWHDLEDNNDIEHYEPGY